MTFPNGGKRDEGHPSRQVMRARFRAGQTLTLEEYKALNPDNAPITERPHHYGHVEPSGAIPSANAINAPAGLPSLRGVSGRVRSPGPGT